MSPLSFFFGGGGVGIRSDFEFLFHFSVKIL